jgi:hypothetical protein
MPFLRSRVAPADNAGTQFAADGVDDTGSFEPEHRRLLQRQQFLEIAAPDLEVCQRYYRSTRGSGR